jgi:peptidoglycan/LPS O-acetylase OafA/YrhL
MRFDIQFLRGIAVLAVVFYHANVWPVPGGYLGVDIFFVISGFLITSIILKGLEADAFSFREFYVRRAKRLLPAAYATLIATTLAGYIFLTETQWLDYLYQFVGALTFSANIFLPMQTGYFEGAAESKPLLHVWSLSLEEQYYLITPFLLAILAPRWRGLMIAIGIVASFALCFLFVSFPFTWWRFPSLGSETFAFFMLPTRAWELLVGSLCAWWMRRFPTTNVHPSGKLIALGLALAVTIFPVDSVHPRFDATLVTLATGLLLIGKDNWLPRNRLTGVVTKVGDWSYSLYLVHWPLFAFAHIGYLGEVPTHVRVGLILASFLLAFLQYAFVEQPFRYGWHANSRKTLQWLSVVSLLVLLVPMPRLAMVHAQAEEASVEPRHARNGILGLNETCSRGRFFEKPEACMFGPEPNTVLWGDSYAMHLVPGLKVGPVAGRGFMQITKAACAPIPGVASLDENYDAAWAKGCLEFNQKVLAFIRQSAEIDTVVLSSPFSGYFDNGPLSLFVAGEEMTGSRDTAIAKMKQTVEALRDHGKRVILVTPPPKAGFDIGECWERRRANLVVFGRTDCNFSIDEYETNQAGIREALKQLDAMPGLGVVWLDQVICRDGLCETSVDGRSLYRDGGHLTAAGAEWVMPRSKLMEFLQAESELPKRNERVDNPGAFQ